MHVTNHKIGRRIVKVYACGWRHARGPAVCSNTLKRETGPIDRAVTDWVASEVLVKTTIARIFAELRKINEERAKAADDQAPALQTEAGKLRAEIARLTSILASAGDAIEPIVAGIGQRQGRLRIVERQLEALQLAPGVIDMDLRRMERDAMESLPELAQALTRNPVEGREVLAALLVEPLKFRAMDGEYEVTGPVSAGNLLRQTVSDPDGTGMVWRQELRVVGRR